MSTDNVDLHLVAWRCDTCTFSADIGVIQEGKDDVEMGEAEARKQHSNHSEFCPGDPSIDQKRTVELALWQNELEDHLGGRLDKVAMRMLREKEGGE